MKSKIKKLLACLAVLCAMGVVAGCGENDGPVDTGSQSSQSSDTGSNTTDTESDSSATDSDTGSSETPATYTVTFAGAEVSAQTIEENGKVAKPADPVKPHYTFDGWYNGETLWDFETDTVAENLTLTAKFTAIEYTVTFIADGEQVGEPVKYTVESEAIQEPTVPAKEGYGGTWEEYVLDGGNKTVNAIYTAGVYTVTFKIDGLTVGKATYTVENKNITEPQVTEKAHYTGVWETYTLEKGDVTVNAVYTPIEYTVTFIADGAQVGEPVKYTVESETITAPNVPDKAHYTGAWEAYALDGGNKTVNAAYTPVTYTITFLDGETVVEAIPFTVEDNDKQAPAISEKAGYTGAWSEYSFASFENQTATLSYTLINYTVTFKANGVQVGEAQNYNVENKNVIAPDVPIKDYYTGAWESYELTLGDVVVNAVYTPVTYTITFLNGEDLVEEIPFTVEDNDKQAPEIPEKAGYTGSWSDYSFTSFENQTVSVDYVANTYLITYDANGGSMETDMPQEVVYDSSYELLNPTASKIYQEFLGWYDEDGKLWTMEGVWTLTSDVTLTAKWSKGVTFDSATEVPSFIQTGGRASLSIVDGNGGKVLQATSENNDQGNVRIMMSLADMGEFFEDPNVEYMAFDLKLPEGATTPVGSIMYHNLDQSNYTAYESGSQFDETPTDAYKTYYLPRSVYETWVANDKTEGRFLNVQAGITYGASYWIDNIRPVTAEEYTADLFSLETGSLRRNISGDTEIGFCQPSYNQFHFRITNVNATTAKFTNENVTDGMRALQFTKNAGETVIMFNANSDPSMETAMRQAGYISFDLYVPEGSDAKIKHLNQAWYGVLKQGWNTVYEKLGEGNDIIKLVDTTASTYIIDNFRVLTEEEYNKAMMGFEAGGVLRENNANDDTVAGWTYYYAGWDKANNKASIQVTEGSSVAVLSNVRLAADQVHSGGYSLAFDKKAGWMALAMASDSEMYSLLKNGFTFWIYSTTALNGTSGNEIVNGYEGKLHGEGIDIEANTWTQITITADDIKGASRFLTLAGNTEGTIYIDDIQPLPATDEE